MSFVTADCAWITGNPESQGKVCRPSGVYRMVEPNAALAFFEGTETQTGFYSRFQRVLLF